MALPPNEVRSQKFFQAAGSLSVMLVVQELRRAGRYVGAGMNDELLGSIYEAGVLADRWPSVLEKLSASCGAKGGVLHVHTPHERRWTASPSMQATFEDYLAAGWPSRSDRVGRGIRMNRPGFITDADLYTEAEMAVQPVFREFLIPRGLQASMGTHVGYAADGDLVLSLWGFQSHAAANESVPALDTLRPHLARASMLAAELQLARACSAVEAFALINVPAAMLGQRRRVLASNALFNSRLPEFGHDTPTGMRLSHARADAAFEDVLARFERPRAGGASLAVQLTGNKPAVLHVLPVRGAARDLMTGARALLMLTAPSGRHPPSAALIRGLFDLTPAEARLAQVLLTTMSLGKAARQLDITEGTARKQLQPVFKKTGTAGQAELLVLLSQYNASVNLG